MLLEMNDGLPQAPLPMSYSCVSVAFSLWVCVKVWLLDLLTDQDLLMLERKGMWDDFQQVAQKSSQKAELRKSLSGGWRWLELPGDVWK